MSRSSYVFRAWVGGIVAGLAIGTLRPSFASMQDPIPPGTRIEIYTAEKIDSSKADLQRAYPAALAAPLVVDGVMFAPKDAAAFLRVVEVQQAGAVSGRTELMLRLEAIVIKGQRVSVQTDTLTSASGSQAKSVAIAGGTAAGGGALVGGIFGGGKGAKVGAEVGGGSGTIFAAKRGQKVELPKETHFTFTVSAQLSESPASTALGIQEVPTRASLGIAATKLDDSYTGVNFHLEQATAEGKTLTVVLIATNTGLDRPLGVGARANGWGCYLYKNGPGVEFVDENANKFAPASIMVSNQESLSELLKGLATKVTLRFDNLPTAGGTIASKTIVRLQVGVQVGEGAGGGAPCGTLEFRNISIQVKQP